MEKNIINKKFINDIICYALSFTMISTGIDMFISSSERMSYKKAFAQNKKTYKIELNEYNENIKKYAEHIKKMNLNDLEIIIKVINDIWNSIDGYGTPDNLIPGLARLSFQEEKRGICTSFVDDFNAKMNAINPEYEAYGIVVYAEVLDKETNEKCTVDIKKNILSSEDTEVPETEKERKSGNHMVSVVKLKDKNLSLIVDPTNLLIGILQNGKIYILNTKRMKMKYISDSTACLTEDNIIEVYKNYYETYFGSKYSLEKVQKEYGLSAQEDALRKVLILDSLIK